MTNLDEAAKRIALAENVAVFHGWRQAAIARITEASPHPAIARSKGVERYPQHVAKAVELLLQSGITGPYGHVS